MAPYVSTAVRAGNPRRPALVLVHHPFQTARTSNVIITRPSPMYTCEPGVWINLIHVIPLDPHPTSNWEALSSSHYFALLESLKSTSKGFPTLLVHDSEFTLGAKGKNDG